ncbi:hypothetical protein [Rhizobium tumorigenes]|uniref:Uncharacterized protein n=1 Tax=Rhizobium tumorigenes TaxID=2041385 RepID=A0AAF1KP48_9HYPH|nr:hypothetical protein [Rhizobium tumorigenes]WFR98778.1 hypothetical protein PR017_24070 [Rhizobium tumorigenes]
MENLKRLFLYKERQNSPESLAAPSIEDNMNAMSVRLAKEVADYLKQGLILIEFVSPTLDPYSQHDMVRNVVFSDGVYFWDGVILHWVEKYRVRMPEEFMRHFYSATSHPIPVNDSDIPKLLAAFKTADPLMALAPEKDRSRHSKLKG